jgi:hypothetical protein
MREFKREASQGPHSRNPPREVLVDIGYNRRHHLQEQVEDEEICRSGTVEVLLVRLGGGRRASCRGTRRLPPELEDRQGLRGRWRHQGKDKAQVKGGLIVNISVEHSCPAHKST